MSGIALPEVKKDMLSQLQQPFELLSKGWIALLAGVYVTGYVIVSIYHASLGLNELNPFRPKVAAAGILFLAFTSAALYIDSHARKIIKADPNIYIGSKKRVYEVVVGGLVTYCLDILTSSACLLLMRYDSDQKNSWEFISLWVVGLLVPLLQKVGKKISWFQKFQTHWAFFALCTALTGILVFLSFPSKGEFNGRQFALVLATIQLAVDLIKNSRNASGLDRVTGWTHLVFLSILPFILFGTWVYPHIKAAFGGGEPTPAEISLNLPSPSQTSDQIKVRIVDETDTGYYLIIGSEKSVHFLPRSVISQVEYAKPSGLFY
jgi:hypothetical protein